MFVGSCLSTISPQRPLEISCLGFDQTGAARSIWPHVERSIERGVRGPRLVDDETLKPIQNAIGDEEQKSGLVLKMSNLPIHVTDNKARSLLKNRRAGRTRSRVKNPTPVNSRSTTSVCESCRLNTASDGSSPASKRLRTMPSRSVINSIPRSARCERSRRNGRASFLVRPDFHERNGDEAFAPIKVLPLAVDEGS